MDGALEKKDRLHWVDVAKGVGVAFPRHLTRLLVRVGSVSGQM